MRNIFFISDTHFNHTNIINYCERPFKNINEMHETIIKNWNKVVKPNDLVYCIGDMMLSTNPNRDRPLIDSLAGVKVLVRGNHDGKPRVMEGAGFIACVEEAVVIIAGERVRLVHRPYPPPFSLFKLLTGKWKARWYKKNPRNTGHYLIHGHTHSKNKFRGKQINVCVDAWDFKPVPVHVIGNYIAQHKKESNNEGSSMHRLIRRIQGVCAKAFS